MTETLPFRGILYDTSRVRGDNVVAPPYDIITPEMKEALYSRDTYNIVKIDFGKDMDGDEASTNRYSRAHDYLNEWLYEGILTDADKPAYYLYEVDYSTGGEKKRMRGIFASVKITELCKGIYPHEATHSKPKADRLNLMRYCNANTSPIFSIYTGRGSNKKEIFERTASTPPYMSASDLDGAVHSMWIIDDSDDVEKIREELLGLPIYIADGHHRYETAMAYQSEMQEKNPAHTGDEAYNYVMMYLVDTEDGGLTILPTHRLLKDDPGEDDSPGGKLDPEKSAEKLLKSLKPYFEIMPLDQSKSIVSEISRHDHAIGLAIHGMEKHFLLVHKGGALDEIPEPIRELDVAILHEVVLNKVHTKQKVEYEMDPDLTLRKVRDGEYRAAFFLNPTRTEDVEMVARKCLRMPPKSTYFYPKILTGFVINRLG